MTSEVSQVNSILVAAHELKSPLALLRQLAFSLDYAENPDDLAKIKTQLVDVSDRALKQVEDLTKIARLEDGLFQLEPVSIRRLCDDVASELDILFAANNRTLDLCYSNRTRLVTANRDLLRSVIYNFCVNAVRYADFDTSATLSLKDCGRDRVRLSVRDRGPALPKDVWQALKKGRLTRPVSISMRPGSSGLGLYIASRFSEYMHAPVGAIRHRDGVSFFVDLPVSHQASLFPC